MPAYLGMALVALLVLIGQFSYSATKRYGTNRVFKFLACAAAGIWVVEEVIRSALPTMPYPFFLLELPADFSKSFGLLVLLSLISGIIGIFVRWFYIGYRGLGRSYLGVEAYKRPTAS